MSATVVSRHFGCTGKTIEHLRRRFRVTGNVADRPRSGRPRMITAINDRYTILQHLRNGRLTAAATNRKYGFHPQTVRNRLRQNVQPIRAYRPYFTEILTRRHRTASRDWRHRSGCPRVTTCGQDRYIQNTHLRNRFQTATATAAKTHGTHINCIYAQTVRNRLRE